MPINYYTVFPESKASKVNGTVFCKYRKITLREKSRKLRNQKSFKATKEKQ